VIFVPARDYLPHAVAEKSLGWWLYAASNLQVRVRVGARVRVRVRVRVGIRFGIRVGARARARARARASRLHAG